MNYGTQLANTIDATYKAIHDEDGMRYHLGGSVVSNKCLRAAWFSYRWAAGESFPGRMLRLFHRGHREEQVVIALLRSVGATVYDRDKDGKQYKVPAACCGHAGGEMDGVAVNLPALPPNVPTGAAVLLEIKTHNDRLFGQLQKHGVYKAHSKHYKQAQFYMHLAGIDWCLYCAVNKNDDELHFEIFPRDPQVGHNLVQRAETVIFGSGIPNRISNVPTWHECTFCPMKGVCFKYEPARFNCRTCRHAVPQRDGTWACMLGHSEIHTSPKIGCHSHQYLPDLA